MKVSPIQNDFSGGLFSPVAQARSDLQRYKTGLAVCENTIPTAQGPATKRSGTRFVSKSLSPGQYTRLIPFSYSNSDNYVVAFSDLWVRIYKNKAILGTIISPYTAAELSDIKYIQQGNTLYLVSGTRAPMVLTRQSDTNWSLEPMAFTVPPLLSVGLDTRLTVITNYTLSAVVTVNTSGPNTTVKSKFNQALNITNAADNGSGDIRLTLNIPDALANGSMVYISGVVGTTNANGDRTLTKTGTNTYDLIGVPFNAPYVSGGSLAPALVLPTDTGRNIALRLGSTAWFYSRIIGIADSHNVLVYAVHPSNPSNVDTPLFKLGAFGDGIGWPNAVTVHQNRLYLAGPQSNTLYGSVVGDYRNFMPVASYLADGTPNSNAIVSATDSLSFTASSTKSSKIEWTVSDEYGVVAGTDGGVFVLRSSSFGEPITPTNASLVWVDTVGVASFQAIRTEKSTIYISESKKKVFELKYFYNIDGFKKTDLTEIAYNIAGQGFTGAPVSLNSPCGLIAFPKHESIAMLTFNRATDNLQAAWSEHFLGGRFDSSLTPPRPLDLTSVFNNDTMSDELWMSVNRTFDDSIPPEVTIEVMDKIFEDFNDPEFYNGLDCGYQHDEPVEVYGAVLGITTTIQTGPVHNLITGDEVEFKGVFGLYDETKVSQVNGRRFVVTVIDPNSFSIELDSSELSAYAGGGEIRKVVTQLTGLNWLADQEVTVYCDGDETKVGKVTVSNTGDVTLPFPSVTVQIGFLFTAKIKGLRTEGISQNGTAIGKYRRVNDIGVILNRSQSFKAGSNFDDMVPVSVKEDSDDDYQNPQKLFSGTLARIGIMSDNAYDSQWCIKSDTPTPLQVLAVMTQINSEDYT